MMQQVLALCLAGMLTLTGCQTALQPTPTDDAVLTQAAVRTAQYPAYPQFVNRMDYLPTQDPETMGEEAYNALYEGAMAQYEADQAAYRAQLDALERDPLSEDFQGAIQDFSLASFRQLLTGEEGGNLVYSPVNLFVALSVLGEITDGDTRQQVLSALGVTSVEELRQECQSLWENLYLDDGIGKKVLANSLWLREGFPFHTDLVERLAANYYASTYQVTMGPQGDDAMARWVNQQTGGLLAQQTGSIQTDPQETILVLLSTLYFYDQWQTPFSESNTAPAPFTTADGETITCDFMNGGWMGGFLANENYTAVSKSFDRGGSMLFLLPQEGKTVAQLAQSGALDGIFDGTAWEGERYGDISLSVPKFDVAATHSWRERLQAMGITRAFDLDSSDFTPLTDESLIYVGKVEQASRVQIDEEGCAAASYVMMEVACGSAMPQDHCELVLDRPFLFVIFDGSIPLFIGTINEL